MKQTLLLRVVLLILLTLFFMFRALPTQAGGVVGSGTAESCSYDVLVEAIEGGGTVTFDCGASPHIIVVEAPIGLFPATDTVVEGGGLISLSGNTSSRLFAIAADSSLTLKNLTLTDGYSAAAPGGAIQNNGQLKLDNVVVTNSHAQTPNLYAGAIHNAAQARLTIRNSTLRANSSAGGGAIYNALSGVVTVERSLITANTVYGSHGGGILNSGTLTLIKSVVSDNRIVSANPTPGLTGGGGISNLFTGRVVLEDASIVNNLSGNDCGGILNRGRLEMRGGEIVENRAPQGDGGGVCGDKTQPFDFPVTNLTDVTVGTNSAVTGGGIAQDQGILELTNVTLSDNSATSGGGIWTYLGTLDLTNVTISGNAATEGGALWNDLSTVNLTNVTLNGNSAVQGGGIFNSAGPGSETNLKNTIIAGSLSGGNCAGAAVAFSKSSLSSDDTCVLAGVGDQNGVDPLLSDLRNHGGSTDVHLPEVGSPAIDGVVGSDAPPRDQRGQPRPSGNGYDIGAVERQPVEPPPPPVWHHFYFPALLNRT